IEKSLQPVDISVVINAAAYTDVDSAEQESGSAFAVNRDGPSYLAARCEQIKVPLIHISTDYVFDGRKKGAYLESDPVSPLGVYGRSKAEGESLIIDCLREHVIIRTSWLYGSHGSNFVKKMLTLGRDEEIIRVVADQHGCPTYAADLAEVILLIAAKIENDGPIDWWGTYHYCGEGQTTWHAFAEAIFEIAKKYDSFAVKEVLPVSTAEYPTPAPRPANSVLDCSKIGKTFGIQPRPWRESLVEMIEKLLVK
ncbi:MAG: dTDP-4-dehydrorhamnose reductase, partial [Deltaproteobacteria bacterium]